MRKLWSDEAWEDYLYWQISDKKILRRINDLLKALNGKDLYLFLQGALSELSDGQF